MRITAITVIMLAALAASGQAQPAPGPVGMGSRDRARVEQQLRRRMSEVVKQRLGLSPEQMRQLNAVNRKFDRGRLALLNRERQVRVGIREEIEAGSEGSPERLSALMDSALFLQRRRLDLLEAEQVELKKFLSPRQRAQYFGLQSQLRNRMEQMRRNRSAVGERRQ